MNEVAIQYQSLALSLCEQYRNDHSLLGKPVSHLAKLRGFTVEVIYKKLLIALMDEDLGERLRYAEIGLELARIIDKNRLREELGISFILTIDRIINIVQQGIDSEEAWIKRKAMKMYGYFLDENAEKTRFVESLLADQKINMIEKSRNNTEKIMQDIMEFEYKNGTFEAISVNRN